jgi:hypothetical protein
MNSMDCRNGLTEKKPMISTVGYWPGAQHKTGIHRLQFFGFRTTSLRRTTASTS